MRFTAVEDSRQWSKRRDSFAHTIEIWSYENTTLSSISFGMDIVFAHCDVFRLFSCEFKLPYRLHKHRQRTLKCSNFGNPLTSCVSGLTLLGFVMCDLKMWKPKSNFRKNSYLVVWYLTGCIFSLQICGRRSHEMFKNYL